MSFGISSVVVHACCICHEDCSCGYGYVGCTGHASHDAPPHNAEDALAQYRALFPDITDAEKAARSEGRAQAWRAIATLAVRALCSTSVTRDTPEWLAAVKKIELAFYDESDREWKP